MRTTYKKINEDEYHVYVHSGNDFDMVGRVVRAWHKNKSNKWSIEPAFVSLLGDHQKLNDLYFDAIDAGRELAAAWLRVNRASYYDDTAEYNFKDFFGDSD